MGSVLVGKTASAPTPVHTWGDEGHRAIAGLRGGLRSRPGVREAVHLDLAESGVGTASFCCRLLPTPPNFTPQPASLKRLSGGLRGVASGVLGGRMHLADVGMLEGPDPAVEALQELVDRVPHPRRATPAART